MNLRSLDLNLLLVFESLLRTRSTTVTAEELNLTQSAVSNALKRLRLAFGDPLFVKTPQGMLPTDFAASLAPPVTEGLGLIRGAVEAPQDFVPAKAQRTFRLYLSDIGQLIFIPKLMATLAVEAPGVRIVTVDTTPREAQNAMAMGDIDLTLGLFTRFSSGFHQQRLFREHYVALVRGAHPTIRGELTVENFLNAAHAVYRPTAGHHDVFETAVEQWFARSGHQRHVALRMAHSMGLSALIAASDLVVCVPTRLGRALKGAADLQTYALPFDSPEFDISQLWHERFHTDAGHRWLRSTIFRLFHGED
ncbi:MULTISPECIES: LysR family transcriptional regulator [Pandoraea]|uniref:LysR family transcriptional regulator n=1 Tax=Pandoraea TaxID=93217 RepID=UPI001F5D185C|nr:MULTISPECIES: LysR family transcriptional regulator [Pandoraea]MCI3206226.1 LysR family transcriptional regulator [Pandoraea sp. LA3]MDN4584254.1 LysR family transcriptional regulator [Pandoraea capi]